MEQEQATSVQEAPAQVEATPDYESMSVEELRGHAFPAEKAAPAPMEGQATAQQATEKAPEIPAQQDERPKWFTEFETNTKRELGSYRQMMSQFQKLPEFVQKQIQQALGQLQTQQQTNPEDLSPQQQQEQARKLVADIVKQTVQAEYGSKVGLLEKLEQQEADNQFVGSVFQLVGERIPNAKEAWDAVWSENAKQIEAGDEQAAAWQERALKEPSLVAWEMLNHQSKQVQAQGQQFAQQRQQAGAKAAQTVKNGAVQLQAKKALAEMSQDELDGLSTEELRQRTQAEGHFKG